MCPLDNASLGRCIPWMMRPLNVASLERCVPWTLRPLNDASLLTIFPWTADTFITSVQWTAEDIIYMVWFGCIPRQSQWGREITCQGWLLPVFAAARVRRGGGSTLWCQLMKLVGTGIYLGGNVIVSMQQSVYSAYRSSSILIADQH